MKRIKFLSVLLVAAFFVFGRENTTGFLDTAAITDTLTTGTVAYTRCYPLSEYEDMRLLIKVDDTTAAGYAIDTVGIIVGYQTGCIALNSSGLRDTVYDDLITIDTILSSEFGDVGSGTLASSGVLTHSWGGADTLSVSGFAVASRWIIPEWDQYIRFWVEGLASNNQNAPLKLYIEPKRRVFIPTK